MEEGAILLGEIIAQLRKDKNLRQRDLAELLGVTVGTISNYETGAHHPDLESLARLAECFHVSVDYLLGRTNLELDLESFNAPYADRVTMGDLFNQIKRLPSEYRKDLVRYIALLRTASQQTEDKK